MNDKYLDKMSPIVEVKTNLLIENLKRRKSEFENIKKCKDEIKDLFENIDNKIIKLKEVYNNFLKLNNNFFGIDSIYFRAKLIDLEFDHLKQTNIFVNNRIYGEYFKLYKIIEDYIKNNFKEKKIINNLLPSKQFVVYKDLEPFKVYDDSSIYDIFDTIITMLTELNSILSNKTLELKNTIQFNNIGTDMNTLFFTIHSNNSQIYLQINLFISYIDQYYKLQYKNLETFINKVRLFLSEIRKDTKVDQKYIHNILGSILGQTTFNDTLNEMTKCTENDFSEPIEYFENDKDKKECSSIENDSDTISQNIEQNTLTNGELKLVKLVKKVIHINSFLS
jgi:hypothetical protein